MHTRAEKLEAFGRLLDIMDELREKCPWDKKQTFESLRHLTIEETHELADAIIDADIQEIKKKLTNQSKNIELVFNYLDELIEKKENEKPRKEIGYKTSKK